MKIYLTRARYESFPFAEGAAVTLVNTVPELRGFITQYGSLLVIRNTTKAKAEEARDWIKKYTTPIVVEIKREKRIVEIGESVRKAQKTVGEIGEQIGRTEEARPTYEMEGGIIGGIEEIWRKYKGKPKEEKRVY